MTSSEYAGIAIYIQCMGVHSNSGRFMDNLSSGSPFRQDFFG